MNLADEERKTAPPSRTCANGCRRSTCPASPTSALTKLRLVLDELEETPGIIGRIAVTGFCFGGTYSYALAAARRTLVCRAAVPFVRASRTGTR